MLTVGVTLAPVAVIVIFPEVPVGLQFSLEVTTQLTTAPLVRELVVNVEEFAPETLFPLILHW